MATRIVTDSCADLPVHLARQLEVVIVPCHIRLDGRSYKDGVDLTGDRFYAMLEDAAEPPSTSQPSIGELQQVYGQLLEQGHHIVSVHISGRLSGTCNAARRAKDALGRGSPIEIVDSEQASVAQGLVVAHAARAAKQELAYQEVAGLLRSVIDRTRAFLAVESLLPLARGGRIGRAKSVLNSPPESVQVLQIRKGELHPALTAPNWGEAKQMLVTLARDFGPMEGLGVGYSTSADEAARLGHSLSDLVAESRFMIAQFGATIGGHVGSNALGLGLTLAGP
ncbi:MAG: DegV family protein [Dehalococcoidia bacterium]